MKRLALSLLALCSCAPSFEAIEIPDSSIASGRDASSEPDAAVDAGVLPEGRRTGWAVMSSTTAPPIRSRHLMTWSPKNRAVLLHGGLDSRIAYGDTWLFDGAWRQLDPRGTTGVKTDHAGSEDRNGNIVIFGGTTQHGGPSSDDTWLWDGSDWTRVRLDVHPSARVFAGIAYDPLRGVVVLGGEDTWEWDGDRWTMVASAENTPGRENFTMWFDPALGKVVLYGGGDRTGSNDTTNTHDDCWTWDGVRWEQLYLPRSPTPGRREAYTAAFDSRRGELVLFSGLAEPDERLDGTWILRDQEWTKLDVREPEPIIFGAAAFDRASGQIVLFGGATRNGRLQGTWIFGQ